MEPPYPPPPPGFDPYGQTVPPGSVPSPAFGGAGSQPTLPHSQPPHPTAPHGPPPGGHTLPPPSGSGPVGRVGAQPGVEGWGPYRIEKELGRGGMGVVYLAFHPELKRQVAIKVLLEAGSGQTLERFRIEAQAVARLRHPHLVQVHDFGLAQGRPYLVLEFVEGGSLDERLRRGPLPARQAAQLMAKVARAVAVAHEAGILHRDLKPHNVLLDRAGEPYLTDFGLARDEGAEQARLSTTGQMLGTPAYMSPEQAEGDLDTIGTVSDVYGLGATLFHCLSGRPPFQGKSTINTIKQVLADPAPRPSAHAPEVGPDLDAICLRCLEKAPADRYATAAALADDLEAYLRGEPVAARPPTALELVGQRVARHRGAVLGGAALGALVVVALAVLSLLAIRRSGEAERALADAERARAELQAKQDEVVAAAERAALERLRAERAGARAQAQAAREQGYLALTRERYDQAREAFQEALAALETSREEGDPAERRARAGEREAALLGQSEAERELSALRVVGRGASAVCTAASGRLLVVASHDGQRGRLELREGPGRAVLAARDLDPALGEPAYLSARGGTLAVGCRLRRPGQRETATLAVFDLEPGSGGGRGGLSPRWRVQHEGTCFSVTVTPDERLICVGWDKGRHEGVLAVYPAGGPGPGERPLQVLDLAELRSGGAPGQPFYELAFLSADVRPTDRRSGRICAAAHPDGTYTLWFQDQRFEPLGRDRYLHPGHSVEAIVALAGPILLSGGGDGRLVVHDLNSDPNSGQEWLAGESGRVACLARAGRAGVLAAGCEDGRVWLLTDSGRLVRRLEAPVDSAIESLCLDRRGRWLAATTLDRQLLAWDADVSHAPGERRACLSRAGVWSFLPQELAGGWSMSLHQVTLGSNGLETGRPRFERRLLTPRVPQIEVVALASSEQGWVAGAFSKDLIEGERRPNGWLAVFDPTGRERWSWPPAGRADDAGSSSGASWIASLAIDPAQEWLAAGAYAPDGEQELRLLPLANADPALLRNPPRLSWHTGTVHAVDFHPSGSLLASGAADATLALWEREAFPAPAAAAGAVVAPSLEFEVVAGRLLSDAQRRRAQGGGRDLDRTRGVTALDFSPDGEWLAAGCADGRVRVWKVDALRAGRIEPAYELAAHGLAVRGVAFCPPQALEGSASPRCLRLVTGSLDRRVCVWDFRRQRQLRQLELGEPVQALAVSHLAPARAAVSGRAGTWLVELDPSPGR